MSTWRDLVTASLIGTERAVVPALEWPSLPPLVASSGAGPPADPAGLLLDRAALATAARRAGRRPGHGEPLPECDPDPRPAMSRDAGARLARMLGGEYPFLLAEWLTAAASRGLRPPPQLLPALLDRAGRAGPSEGRPSDGRLGDGRPSDGRLGDGRPSDGRLGDGRLQRLAAEVGGPRARWLAALNADWDFVTSDSPGPDAWRLGDASQRRGYLAWLLAADPDAGRELIAAGWASAPVRERLEFLAVLASRLGPADEPLLEAALGDPSPDVRTRAGWLLATLPASALSQRMAALALRCVQIESGARTSQTGPGAGRPRSELGSGGPRLIVTPAADRDDLMRHDGIPPIPAAPGSARPDRRRLLFEIVARTPLRTWTDTSGLAPAQIVALPAGEWAPALFTGWARAAIAQRDRAWTTALIRYSLAGQPRFPAAQLPAAQLPAVRELAREADPALGAPGALPGPGPDTPPAVRAALAVLRFRWKMLAELAPAEGARHDDPGA